MKKNFGRIQTGVPVHLIFSLLILSLLGYRLTGQTVIYISVVQEPNLVVSAGTDQNIVKGHQVQIGGSPAAQFGYAQYAYLWTPSKGLSNSTIANPIASPDTTTIYTLTVTDGQHCIEMDGVQVTVRSSASIGELPKWNLEVYPNPADDLLNVRLSGIPGKITLLLVNTLGSVIFKQEYFGNAEISEQIDTKWLSKGLYYLRLQSDQVLANRIVVKQ
jgi:hypothetical protein